MKRQGVSIISGLALLVPLALGILQAQTAATLSNHTDGAMLYANGNARVNGQPAGTSTSIFAGDRIDVADSSAVSINRSGSSVVVSPNSSIQYEPASVEVVQGTVHVSTSQGMAVRAGNVLVAPGGKNTVASYDVIAAGSKITIVSREGSLTASDRGRTVALEAGSKTTLAFVATTGQVIATDQLAQTAATDKLLDERLSEHPFYGVLKGVDSAPATLPLCSNVEECIRPNVSQIRPCCCPPRVLCK